MRTENTPDDVTSNSYRRLLKLMADFGNTLLARHRAALYKMLETFTYLAELQVDSSQYKGRRALPLPIGAGKTLGVSCWLIANHELQTKHSAVICQSKIEQLATLYRTLVDAGIPRDTVGIIHSYKYNRQHAKAVLDGDEILKPGFATVMCSPKPAHEYKYLLITHERLKSAEDIQTFNTYQDRDRSLCVWDETLHSAQATTVSTKDLAEHLGAARGIFGSPLFEAESIQHARLGYLIDYVDSCMKIINNELHKQKELKASPSECLKLPRATTDQLREYRGAILHAFRFNHRARDCLSNFIDIAQQQRHRVMCTPHGNGIITYDLLIPDSLKHIAILDASTYIRKIVNLDDSIEPETGYANIKSFNNVQVTQLINYASGRNTFDKKLNAASPLMKEIMSYIKSWPQDQATIFWIFKPKNPSRYCPESEIRQALQLEDIDDQETIEVITKDGPKLKPRFIFQRWGNETGNNHFSYAHNSVMCGVLRRSFLDLSSSIAATKRNLHSTVEHDQLRSVDLSERAHVIYQAIGRSRLRITDGCGQALASRVLLLCKDDYSEHMDEVLPGIQWIRKEGNFNQSRTKVAATERAIVDFLTETEDTEIDIREMRSYLKLNVSKNTFSRARKKAIQDTAWKVERNNYLVRDCPFNTVPA